MPFFSLVNIGSLTVLLGLFGAFTPAWSQVSDGVVRIGVLASISTQGSHIGGEGSIEAARMAIADVGGRVLGREVELVAADMQDKPDIGSSIAREWYDRGGVDAIFDMPNSAVALAVLEVARQRNRILVTSGAGTTEFSGRLCAPTGFQWAFDTFALTTGTTRALIRRGYRSWFLNVSDFAFGHALERDATAAVRAEGGQVIGSVRHPPVTTDLASPLLRARQSGAQVIGLAEGPPDNVNAVKQAAEFGITRSNVQLAAFYMTIMDVHSLGLETAQGLLLTEAFYWDQNEATRRFAKRFFERRGTMPTMQQAGVYSSVSHYLKAVQAAGTDDGPAVAEKMRELVVEDFFAGRGTVRPDGLMAHDMVLVQVKSPGESRYAWDYYTVLEVLPSADITRPLADSACPTAKRP